ncbi:MAG TPA: hypothetical protein VNL77_16695 [Roseiflexaceae bacterium]|nr:hypothetical protein [Roseiflexaceae bacterium]
MTRLGIAGDIRLNNPSGAALGIAGNLTARLRPAVEDALEMAAAALAHNARQARVTIASERLGDVAAKVAARYGFLFSDFCYLVTVDRANGHITWQKGRETLFHRNLRALPLAIDSSGYRRCISGTAPRWATLPRYLEAIWLIQPEECAAWDDPRSRAASLASLREMDGCLPPDVRLWPVFSIRWLEEPAAISPHRIPATWARRHVLAGLIPLTRTQQPITEATRDAAARKALAYALAVAEDPDFRAMAARYGRVMIGGMLHFAGLPRMARHIFGSALHALMPGVDIWLLGCANWQTINGLGVLETLLALRLDGSSWLHDARANYGAFLDGGLITIQRLTGAHADRASPLRIPFFTLTELAACHLRAQLSAYAGIWRWPTAPTLPLDIRDAEQIRTLREVYVQTAYDLGLIS